MIWLSTAEATLLADGLEVPIRNFPFKFPGSSPLIEDQQREMVAVAQRLTERGLFHRGALDEDLERALLLLRDWDRAIAVLGTVDRSREIYARVHTDGKAAVLIIQQDGDVGIDLVEPYLFSTTAAELLTDLPAARGQSITVYAATPVRWGDDDTLLVPAFGSGRGPQLDKVEALMSRERTGTGYFVPFTRVDGKQTRLSGITWMDTDLGRYMVTGGDSEGRSWASYTPAGRDRFRNQLDYVLSGEDA